ncbi:hypothetical protein [Chenggangzhangella methanolivorans]|uniref:Uncharacterized protein n=1 Tax=Chenggangzhangella methanolivorans TaxID=1437009 RepID=A0A9E6RC72_9HYPH|nr:hypothetical protein [Chenggangzhangella methanolivorans]QZO00624.1 hypothetical protein K6K41_02605 [Chenggangzhangella methanolivorans]
MRTHVELTPWQAAANAICRGAPKAVISVALNSSRRSTVKDRLDLLRAEPLDDRGGLTLKAAELAVRKLSEVLPRARAETRKARGVYQAPAVTKVSDRLTALRQGLATHAAKLGIRTGANFSIAVHVADLARYEVRHRYRWIEFLRIDSWDHRICLPRWWMTAARQVGRLSGALGLLNDGRFVFDAIHVRTVYHEVNSSSIYEVDTIARGRRIIDNRIERIHVRVWPHNFETYHPTLRQALRAVAPGEVLSALGREEEERARDRSDMAALDMELC